MFEIKAHLSRGQPEVLEALDDDALIPTGGKGLGNHTNGNLSTGIYSQGYPEPATRNEAQFNLKASQLISLNSGEG